MDGGKPSEPWKGKTMNDNDKENEATTGRCENCGGETATQDTLQCAQCHVTLCESCV